VASVYSFTYKVENDLYQILRLEFSFSEPERVSVLNSDVKVEKKFKGDTDRGGGGVRERGGL